MPTVLASGQLVPFWQIAVDATSVYWANNNGGKGQVMKCAKAGCPGGPTPLAPPSNSLQGLAVDESNAYWTEGDGLPVRATGRANRGTALGRVLKCASAGCNGTPTVLATSQNNPMGIAVDATNVYWTNRVDQCGPDGTRSLYSTLPDGQIMTMPK